jgi:DNA repair protein SbcC/Rad50
MRPHKLELAGFTAFRESVEIDFADADLFALVGPTGAGKTSIIDALCFALYGRVPRLDGRMVAPVISAGRPEARICFDFTVDGRSYTAVRIVRRSGQGASTAEARLEQDGEVLAGDADGVTKAVEALLGLSYEQFTTCVVLPQGEFARFLRDTPKGRQELLVRLLELDVYRRMGHAANQRAAAAGALAQAAADQLAQLTDATEDAVAAAQGRIERLRALRAQVQAAMPRLDGLLAEGRQVVADGEAAARRADLLATVTPPDGLDALLDAAERVDADARAAQTRYERAEVALGQAEQALVTLGDRTELELVRSAHTERVRLAADLPALVDAFERAQAEAAAARAGVGQAEVRLEAARREHAAHDLSRHLIAGAPCPVCEQPVRTPPVRPAPAALTDAERARQVAAVEYDRATSAAAAADGAVQARRTRLFELEQALADQPNPDELERVLAAVGAAEAAVAAARAAEKAARSAARLARDDQRETERRLWEAWRRFDAARDTVAALDPPVADRENLATAWASLVEWAKARESAERAVAADAAGRAAALREEYRRAHGELIAACTAYGAELDGTDLVPGVLGALARAEADLDRLRADRSRAADLRIQVERQTERHQVARTLGRHLAANRFEQWLLDEALGRLVDGASSVLCQLSSGQYSLDLDAAAQFQVVDHRNADERRSARTLSGGETFLASLALALTLAEQLAELAATGGGRLESIFLDEGFGTLDGETLDVVTAAIEELGARGRTVGLVTHVRELAERTPVRFEVRRTPSTSTVERVEQ